MENNFMDTDFIETEGQEINAELEEKNKKLRAENEKLKADAESYYNSYKLSCECNGKLNDKIAELQKNYDTAQVDATRARKIGQKYVDISEKYKQALACISDIIHKTIDIGGVPLIEDDCIKILSIIKQAKGEE